MQRSEVCIDACLLGRGDSTFLQQAAHLTDGVYLKPKHRGALLQYLLVRLMVDSWFFTGCPALMLLACQSRCSRNMTSIELLADVVQTVFCGDGFSRGFLALPRQAGVDFRASCFCHRVSASQPGICMQLAGVVGDWLKHPKRCMRKD